MANVHDVETKVTQVLDIASAALESETEQRYQELQANIHSLEILAREALQSNLSNLCQPILSKLENDKPLSGADQDVLRLLLIAEAEYYLQHEDDLNNWRDEVQRLLDEIRQLQSGLDEVDSLVRLQAFCREAMRVLPDLVYYFREQERVRRFEEATHEPLTRQARRTLIDLIRVMLASDKL